MMTARVVLRIPTTKNHQSVEVDQQQHHHHQDPNNNDEDNDVATNNNSTRIIPGKRLRIPPSLCISVRDSMISSSSSSSKNSSDTASSTSTSSIASSTMLMGKDMMTKHMRDEWRKCLNEMSEYEI